MQFGIISAITGISLSAYFYNKYLNRLITQFPDSPIQEIIRQVYLRISTKQNIKVFQSLFTLQKNQLLLKPYEYTLKTGGKKIRLIMAVIISELFIGRRHDGKIPSEVLLVGGLIELLHTASLIIDDIEDESKLRRGKPCSYLLHGMDKSINAANLMYFLPFQHLLSFIESQQKKQKIIKIFSQQMILSHMGQAQDILVHKLDCTRNLPTSQEYQTLTLAKTGSLLRMMVKMLCVLLNRSEQESEKLAQAMTYVGIAFQVTDDILNLTKNLGKGEIAEDLREKKFTLIIDGMRNNEKFMNMFIINQKDDQIIEKMLEMILSSDVVQKTKKKAQLYEKKAEELIENLQTPFSKMNFKKLMKFIIKRQN